MPSKVVLTRTDGPEVLFAHRELADPRTGEVVLAPGFAERLVALRMAFAKPMIVTSCCRSLAYNASVGGHPRSLHVFDNPHWPTKGTCAIDVAITDGNGRGWLILKALEREWSVGVAQSFLHLDRRVDYTSRSNVVFVYN